MVKGRAAKKASALLLKFGHVVLVFTESYVTVDTGHVNCVMELCLYAYCRRDIPGCTRSNAPDNSDTCVAGGRQKYSNKQLQGPE